MIIAIMHGGPQDGLELAVPRAEALVFPAFSMEFPGRLRPEDEKRLTVEMLIYAPELDTLTPCPCRPDCPHATCHFRYEPPKGKR